MHRAMGFTSFSPPGALFGSHPSVSPSTHTPLLSIQLEPYKYFCVILNIYFWASPTTCRNENEQLSPDVDCLLPPEEEIAAEIFYFNISLLFLNVELKSELPDLEFFLYTRNPPHHQIVANLFPLHFQCVLYQSYYFIVSKSYTTLLIDNLH